MMNDKDEEKLRETMMLYARESLMMNVTEDILVTMEDQNVSKTKLAQLLGKSRAFITQMLGGSRNMTLRTLSDIAFALDVDIEIKFTPKKKSFDFDKKDQWEKSSSVFLSSQKKHSPHVTKLNKKTSYIEDCKKWAEAA